MHPLRLSLFALLLLTVLGLSQEAEAAPTASFTITVKSSFADDDGVAYNGSNVDEDYSIVVFNASSSSPGNYSIDSYSWDFYLESV